MPYYEKVLSYTKLSEDLFENLRLLKIDYKNYLIKDKNYDSDDDDIWVITNSLSLL